MVLVGTCAFFGIALLGPALSSAGDHAVRTVLDGEAGRGRLKAAKAREYAKSKSIQIAQACCTQCKQDWDYEADRCSFPSQDATACIAACGAEGPKPVKKAAH
jgi:hypothetical protein